jgi:uncharacterized protein
MGSLKRLAGCATATLILLANGSARAEVSLIDAVRNHDKAAVRTLLQNRADVNATGADGATPLHWAAHMDDAETAAVLIANGANVKTVNRHGVSPLWLAAINGNASLIELLLKAGADPNTTAAGGETVLMTAARTGKPEAVKALIAHGADVNLKERARGQSALMWAAAEGNTAVIEVLAANKADLRARSAGGFSPLLFAVREGKLDAVRALIKAGADINEKTLAPPTARRKPAGQADSGEPAGGTSALVLAVANAHFELAAYLLAAKADPNADEQGWSALHQITWVRNPGYGDNKPGPQGSGSVDSLDLVRRLAAAGANINARMTKKAEMGTTALDNVGATPFLLAARAADTELMRLLIELGADPLLANAANVTPLLAAAGVGTHSPGEDAGIEAEAVAAVKLALDLGGDINAVDSNGDSAMHGAAYKQFPAVVRFLAEKGARPEIWNQKNKSGWTPLMIAEGVQRGNNIRTSASTAEAIRQALNPR